MNENVEKREAIINPEILPEKCDHKRRRWKAV